MTDTSSGENNIHKMSNKYGITKKELTVIMDLRGKESLEKYEEMGGIKNFAKRLNVSTEKGISKNEIDERKQVFGANSIPPKKPQTFLELCLATLEDATLQVLIACAAFSIILAIFNFATSSCDDSEKLQCMPIKNNMGDNNHHRRSVRDITDLITQLTNEVADTYIPDTINNNFRHIDSRNYNGRSTDICGATSFVVKYADFIEGGMILLTIIIVMLVTATNDYLKELQFRSLQNQLKADQKVTVIREGDNIEILVAELVVGDLVQCKYGDLLPADGMLVSSNDLKVDESSLTGESDHVKKSIDRDPAMLGGTHVMEGSGRMIVTAVGVNSQSGKIFVLLGAGSSEADLSDDGPAYTDGEGAPIAPTSSSDETDTSDETKSIIQGKLDSLTVLITLIGTTACFATIIVLFINWIIDYSGSTSYEIKIDENGELRPQTNLTESEKIKPNEVFPFTYCWLDYVSEILAFVIIGVTVLVVAIPEGLPLAVTISLALSVKKMMKDNNLVRHLDSCETMGNATAICSDKTGTLTTNRMTVVQSFVDARYWTTCIPNPMLWNSHTREVFLQGIALNTNYTSNVVPDEMGGRDQQLGNKTECALLGFMNEMSGETGITYQQLREETPEANFLKVYTFNSARKSMSTIVPIKNTSGDSNNNRVYTKGASEIITRKCSHILNQDGQPQKFGRDERKGLTRVINEMAKDGLRTIGLAYKDIPADYDLEDESGILSNLVLIAIVGIEDPVRPEVPAAIQKCQQAGITVRMVTGDNVVTARSIAQKCGIISPGDKESLVLEGKEFNRQIRDIRGHIKQNLIDKIWPKLKVLARSSPTDKHTLVKGMIDSKMDNQPLQVVAVTGDGTNDGPALKVADVGFAMGIAGTDVAKEASDIILIDDNFSSIVKAVKWGRNVYDNISKFLQFQLTVNVCAILCAVVGSATIGASPLKAVQMLWVNLIMDTLASLALASEPPTDDLLTRKPYPRNKALVSKTMAKNIGCHAFYQFAIMCMALFTPQFLPCNDAIAQIELDDGRISQCWGSGTTKQFSNSTNIWGVTPYKSYELSGKLAKTYPTEQFTLVFNLFVCLQLFNQINARKIHGEWNVFAYIQHNKLFLAILLVEFILQVVIVQFAGTVTACSSLSGKQWLYCIFIGFSELLVGQIINILPNEWFVKLYGCVIGLKNKFCSNQVQDSEGQNDKDRNISRFFWQRGFGRVRQQINLAKRYSIAPGEMSSTDLCRLRQSQLSLQAKQNKEVSIGQDRPNSQCQKSESFNPNLQTLTENETVKEFKQPESTNDKNYVTPQESAAIKQATFSTLTNSPINVQE
jgi:Ca2+ transporting ATPase